MQESKKGEIIVVTNDKGGVGKSTTSKFFSYILSLFFDVLTIDMDTQNSLTKYFLGGKGIKENKWREKVQNKTIAEALLDLIDVKDTLISIKDNWDLIPSDDILRELDAQLKVNREYKLHHILEKIRKNYDYIIIDTPSNLPIHTRLAMATAHYIVVPTTLEKWAKDGIEEINKYHKKYNQGIQSLLNRKADDIYILPTMMERVPKVQNRLLNDLESVYKNKIVGGISRRTDVQQLAYLADRLDDIRDTLAYDEYLIALNKILKEKKLSNECSKAKKKAKKEGQGD